MAYAAIVSFAQTLHQILSHGHCYISLEETQQLRALQRCAILLQEFFQDFPEKAHSLEARIRDAANETENKIEFLVWKQLRDEAKHKAGCRGRKRSRTHRRQLGCHFPKLEKISEKIKSIAEQVMNIKSSSFTGVSSSSATSSSSRIAPTIMIGFDEDLIAIKDRLCGSSSNLQIIPIVGMGGIGKTTLARNAFRDQLIMGYFDIRVWVTVSQDYCAQQVLLRILLSIDESCSESSCKSNESVGTKIYQGLIGRRYLIVMDDMWSEKAWDDLKWVFPDDGNGSRIMLTSRLSVVAAYPDPRTPHHDIRLLNADQSWDLLRHKLFADKDCPPELENIGKKIATSCRGLPLAIVVIAGVLLMVGKTPSSWGVIAENVNSTIATKDGPLGKVLSLSYDHLPHHLRPCFLYMGGFPEDYEIRVSKLVKMWVAEGFLRRKNESISLEEEAEEYLEDLVKRSLIFVSKMKSNGKMKSCSLHDLVRDLCIRKAQEEKFLHFAEKVLPENLENQRRLSVAHIKGDFLAGINDPTIRTIQCFHCEGITAASLGKYKLLRVLVTEFTEFMGESQGVKSIYAYGQASELFHLRYLDLFHGNSPRVAISNLQNLQTLIIHAWKTSRDYPARLMELPPVIWKMPQLRHLVSYFFDTFPSPLKEDLALENLQTLSLLPNFVCSRRVLRRIPNLKKLGICFRHRRGIDGYVDFQLQNLVYLLQLEKLKIKILAHFPEGYRQKLNPVYPSTLKKLTLSGWRLPWEGITVLGSLPNLEVLKLRELAYKGRTWETNEGEFPQLKYLLIDKTDLQRWITESSHFPRLKSLLLRRCWCLTEIPSEIGEINTLELIDVDNANKPLVESAKRIQEEQQSLGNDGLQVRWMRS